MTGCAGSFSKFSKADYERQTTATIITLKDWHQTDKFREYWIVDSNPALGPNPSKGRVNTMIPIGIGAGWLIAWALPPETIIFEIKFKPRRAFQTVLTGSEQWSVSNNESLGWVKKTKE